MFLLYSMIKSIWFSIQLSSLLYVTELIITWHYFSLLNFVHLNIIKRLALIFLYLFLFVKSAIVLRVSIALSSISSSYCSELSNLVSFLRFMISIICVILKASCLNLFVQSCGYNICISANYAFPSICHDMHWVSMYTPLSFMFLS